MSDVLKSPDVCSPSSCALSSLQRTPSSPSPVQAAVPWWPVPSTLFLLRGMSRCPWRCRGWFLWQPREGNPAASHCHETATYTHSSRPLRKKNSKHATVSFKPGTRVKKTRGHGREVKRRRAADTCCIVMCVCVCAWVGGWMGMDVGC